MILNRETIARAGLALLDRHGSENLTMRSVAAALDVQAPALYWHVKNRRDLVDAMADEMFGDAVKNFDLSTPEWDQFLAGAARVLRREMLRYHQGARILAGTATARAADITEPMLNVMMKAGFTLRDAARLTPTIFHYTIGFTIEQQTRDGFEYPESNPYSEENLREHVDLIAHPMVAQAFSELYQPDFDADFEDGLAIIIDGLRARLRGKRKSAAPRVTDRR
ncbi:TetR/AcrR family transcriptional regulator C-terminal domain-containing protein [Mycobacterium sp. D16R24]|uniref:TetR/AcrR family transcriptional regulator C-terminal domain-containing protein n=1 Tax=Mycobacterium sp. D16R24 TaxID=1855656 RepID=UPI000991E3FE|nr:TetR/AcrR family transcriptional regulator C-terminal domain-containing protein [Mycobacterium sp. D16R24]